MTKTTAGKTGKKPDVETLQGENGYRMILELEFSEMIPFVLKNIRRGGIIPLLFMVINLICLIFIIIYSVWSAQHAYLRPGNIIWQILAGILAGSFLIIPPHELLHGLAYWILGAKRIKFGADFQQFIFYVTADRFPISKKELVFLALTPFVVINLAAIVFTVTCGSRYALFSASLLLCHNIMCIGDFAIINYTIGQKGNIYTFDDARNRKSYFFKKED